MVDHSSDKVAHIHQELHSHLPAEPALRTKALESLLVEKGMVDPATVDAWVDAHAETIGPKNGAKVIARSWLDPEFKAHLLEDAGAAIEELSCCKVIPPWSKTLMTYTISSFAPCVRVIRWDYWGWHRLGTKWLRTDRAQFENHARSWKNLAFNFHRTSLFEFGTALRSFVILSFHSAPLAPRVGMKNASRVSSRAMP